MPHLFDSGCPRIMPPDKSLNSTLYGRYRVSTNSKIKRQNFLDFQISIFTKNQNSRALYPISLSFDHSICALSLVRYHPALGVRYHRFQQPSIIIINNSYSIDPIHYYLVPRLVFVIVIYYEKK